ncbi:hypothetical protein BEP19_16025 [Ammoniphilus oxalaticus]|uniref:Uncharacterized protein n=1 Tax=Ammoniphilus oxalaticus TaxID=66863 RepID=A0A419SQW5_9BACL|nr:hypothetical protein BEP19_16025 [Ammoniphilus oxalaticus]
MRRKYDRHESEIKLPFWLSNSTKELIVSAVKNNTPIIITGAQKPTGKTSLKNILESQNILVFEEWECAKIVLDEPIDL